MIVIKHRRCRDVILLQVKARRLQGYDFSGAFLVQASLSGASCVGARFPGANLREADFRDADLRDAVLCGANLRGADFCSADLRGADLRGTNLEDANLTGVIHDRRTRWPEGWTPQPSAAPNRRRDRSLTAVWVDQAGTQLQEWGRPVAAGWAALPVSRLVAVRHASLERANRSGVPLISTLVLAVGIIVAAAALLKQPSARPRHEVAQAPVVMVMPRPSRAVDATPLPPQPKVIHATPVRQAAISNPKTSRTRRTVLARSVTHPIWRQVAEVPHHRVSRKAVRVARREASPALVAGARSSTQRGAATPERPFVAQVPAPSSRRVILAEYTPVEQSAPAEQPSRSAVRKTRKKRHEEPAKPRMVEAWGNPGFHYGSGYDMYQMHVR